MAWGDELVRDMRARGDARVVPAAKLTSAPKPRRAKLPNKTEARYMGRLEAQRLAGEIVSYQFEAVTLRLANDVRYTPDFFVVDAKGAAFLVEVKGPKVWDDARVKFRCAVELYPFFRFVWAQFIRGEWFVEEHAPAARSSR